MGCLRKAILAVLLAVPLACQPAEPLPPLGKIVERPWEPMESTEYRMASAKLGPVPNSGLLLPVVSPDGQWIAGLQTPPDNPPGPEDLLRGDGCERNILLARQTALGAPPHVACDAGAMWAAWSPAGGTLVFTARGVEGRGELGLHDVSTGVTQRLAVGPRRLAMPAVCPAGDKIALVNADSYPLSSRIYILNLLDHTFQPGPPASEGSRQLWPQWIDGQTLVFLDWTRPSPTRPTDSAEATTKPAPHPDGGGPARLCRWTLGQADVQAVAPLGELPSTIEALQLFVSVPHPVSPDGTSLAFYDRPADRLAVVDLAKGTTRSVGSQTRAGCWMGGDLLAAADKDFFVFGDGGRSDGSRMLRGQWLPLWADSKDGTILLCTRGTTDDAFELVRVYLVWRR